MRESSVLQEVRYFCIDIINNVLIFNLNINEKTYAEEIKL